MFIIQKAMKHKQLLYLRNKATVHKKGVWIILKGREEKIKLKFI